MKFIDRTGMKFGRLTVESVSFRRKSKVYWKCWCACGNPEPVIVSSSCLRLKGRSTKSCGCLRVEATKRRATTHGNTVAGSKLRPFYYWLQHIKSRCNNPKNKGYWRYGGRGIKCLIETP